MRTPTLIAVAIALATNPAVIPGDLEPVGTSVERLVDILTSNELEGRLTGSAGERAAASYLTKELERLGVEPLPGQESLQVSFQFDAGVADGGSAITIGGEDGETVYDAARDVTALSFSPEGVVTGPVVFAGYGLVVPAGRGPGFDSYTHLNVRDKIVVVLRYLPEGLDDARRGALAHHAGLRQKARAAQERGAKGLLVVSGPRSSYAGRTPEMGGDPLAPDLQIPTAGISERVAGALLAAAGDRNLEQVQAQMDALDPQVSGFELPGLELSLTTKVKRESRRGTNVIGYLPAATGKAPGEGLSILLGAHYDHLGRGRQGESMAKKGEGGKVHPGADDNVSGVVAVLLAADELASAPLSHPVVLAFWSGTEQGRVGSRSFVEAGAPPPDRLMASVNLDGVGRVRDNRIEIRGVQSSETWRSLIERANVPVGLDIRTFDGATASSDASTFLLAEVPSVGLSTGGHQDLHRPTDRPEELNVEDLSRVSRFVSLLARKLDELDQPLAFAKKAAEPIDHPEDRRAYTGTIPDYAAELEGLRLSGVMEGGPAEKAGLAEGDVIVEFAGRKISNIYDYGEALDVVRVDQPIHVVFLRGEERLEATITPTARP
jgi:hypothetical protein